MKSNLIIHDDCLRAMRGMPAESIKAIITSPPYNISVGGRPEGEIKVLIQKYAGHDDNMPRDEYVAWMRDVMGEMMRLISPDGAIFWNHKNPIKDGLMIDNSEIVRGFPVRQQIIWARTGAFAFNPHYFAPSHEIIYLICKPKFRLKNGMHKMMDVWHIHQERNNPDHPTPFPIEIPLRCIKAAVAEGDEKSIILDPFSGSGTTAIAATKLGVRWIGIEKSEEYVVLARERITCETNQTKFAM